MPDPVTIGSTVPSTAPATAPTAPVTPAKPDALIVPKGNGDLAAFKRFEKVLGVPKIYSRNQGDSNFITGHPDDTLNFPSNHETRPKEARYKWAVQPNGIQYGTLADGAKDCRAGYEPKEVEVDGGDA